MRKFAKLIALVIVLGALIGSYVYLSKKPPKEQAKQSSQDSTKIQLAKVDSKTITKMNLVTKKGNLSLEKSGDNWVVKSAEGVKLNKTAVDDLVSSFSNIQAEKLVEENPTDLDAYGLKNPAATATATLSDGKQEEFYVGNQTAQGSTYYLMMKGDPKVYTVWTNHGSHFSYTLSDIRDTNFVNINLEELQYIKIAKQNQKTIEIGLNDNQSENEKSYNLNTWLMKQPYSVSQAVNDNVYNEVIQGMQQLTIKEFVEDNPTDLAKYGLDKPTMEILAKDSSNKLHIYVGKDKDDSTAYFKTDDSPAVYTIDKSKLTGFNKKPFDLIQKLIRIIYIDDVDKIEIEGNGTKNVITMSRTTKPAEKSGDKDEVVTTYKLNDKNIEEKDMKAFYQTLIGISAESENDKKLSENPEVKITYYLNKGDAKQVNINFCPYNIDFYAAYVDGKSDFLVSKQQVQKMLDDLNALAK